MSATVGFAQRLSTDGFLCENSVFSVTLWCLLARKSSTTETQRTQRLHREELDRDFLCKAATVTAFRCAFCLLALFFIVANVSAKTVYVDLLAANQNHADGSYERPFTSWRVALQHVSSGDTLVAKNGDYRKAGAPARWGGLHLTLTLADELEKDDPRPNVSARPDATGIYRYDPKNPLTIRAESKHGVIIDHIRFHLAQGIVIDGFDIIPNPYYRDATGKKLDEVLVRLLNERARCVCEVGRLKKEQGIEVYQPDREKEVLSHVRSIAAEGPLGGEAVARLFERIIDEARRLERRVVHGGADPLEDSPARGPV